MKKYTYREGIIAVSKESLEISKNKRTAAKHWCKRIIVLIIPVKSLEKAESHFIHKMFRREEPSIKSKIYFVNVFILFSSISTCGSVIINVRVGEKAQLHFPYPCDSAVVTLQHANARPFFRSADPHYKSLSSNQNLVNYTETGHADQCFLNLTIHPVTRSDQGTYILTAYKNGEMLPEYPRIYLGVDYPPGKASCEKSNDYNDGEWVSLQCTASVGTLPGQIVCYQNGMTLPKWKTPTEGGGNLNQIILARLDGLVYCCSSVLTGIEDKCNCTDCRMDPMIDSISDIADPCPQLMSTHLPTSTHNVSADKMNSSSSNPVTAPSKYPENHKNSSYWTVACALIAVISFLAIITLSIAYTCLYRRKAKELARLRSSIKPESTDPCLSDDREEVV